MHEKHRRQFFFLIFGFFCTTACIQIFPNAVALFEVFPSESKKELVSIPDLNNLKPGWWRYLNVDLEELDGNVESFLALLDEAINGLDEGQRKEVLALAQRVRFNINALPERRRIESPKIPSSKVFLSEYTLEQYLALEQRLQSKEQSLIAGNLDITAEKQVLSRSKEISDELMQAYSSTESRSLGRLQLALEIIFEWSSRELRVEQQRLRHANQRILDKEIAQLSEEVQVARDRLDTRSLNTEELLRSIEDVQQKVDEVKSEVERSEARALEPVGEDELSKAQGLQAKQEFIHAQATQARYQSELYTYEAKLALIELLRDSEKELSSAQRRKITAWYGELNRISSIRNKWEEGSQRELNRAVQAVSASNNQEVSEELKTVLRNRLNLAQDSLVLLQQIDGAIRQGKQILGLLEYLEENNSGDFLFFFKKIGSSALSTLVGVPQWLNYTIFTVSDTPVTLLGLFRVVIIMWLSFWVSSFMRKALRRLGEQHEERFNKSVLYNFGRLTHYVILSTGAVFALASMGLDFTNLALVAGALSVGIGFGLQSIVNNFFAGLILLFERNLNVGDFIELEQGLRGLVLEINFRSTLVQTNDGIDVIVPNSEFVNARVINWTLQDAHRRLRIPFCVAYDSDKNLVKKAALEAAERVQYTLQKKGHKKAKVRVVAFGDSSLDFELVVWLDAYGSKHLRSAESAYLWALDDVFRTYKIEVPYPQRDLHIRSDLTKEVKVVEELEEKEEDHDL